MKAKPITLIRIVNMYFLQHHPSNDEPFSLSTRYQDTPLIAIDVHIMCEDIKMNISGIKPAHLLNEYLCYIIICTLMVQLTTPYIQCVVQWLKAINSMTSTIQHITL